MNIPIVGDIGTKVTLDAGTDITGAAVMRIYYVKPSGETGYWTALLGEDNRSIYYVTQAGDLDEAGVWKLQAYVEVGTWKGRGEQTKLPVHEAI